MDTKMNLALFPTKTNFAVNLIVQFNILLYIVMLF